MPPLYYAHPSLIRRPQSKKGQKGTTPEPSNPGVVFSKNGKKKVNLNKDKTRQAVMKTELWLKCPLGLVVD